MQSQLKQLFSDFIKNPTAQWRSPRIAATAIVTALVVLSVWAAGAQPRLGVATSSGPVQLQIHGLKSNLVYQIKASTNLREWTVIGQRAASNGTVTVTDPQAGQFPQRYYQAAAPPATLTAFGEDNFAPDKILVKPKLGVHLGSLNLSLGVSVLNIFPAIGNLQVVQVPPATTADTLIALYMQSGLVQYAEPDFYVRALATPDDQYYPYLWGFHNTGQFGGVTNDDIDAPDAWSIQNSASNIIVAVVDTGVRYTHQDLAPNMWVNPADGSHGTNVVANGRAPNDPWDDYGHGTHVSGTIGAVGNNSVGVVGVAWNARIMACKFLDTNGIGTIDGAIACMDFARANGAKVVNASWGAASFTSQSLHDAVASLRDAGIMFVVAAGNSGANNDTTPFYPASYSDLDNVIAVAASDESDNITSFSDYGATNVDLAAPGTLIYSTYNGSDSDYQYLDGTSMACAMMSGAVAAMEAHFPGESYLQIKQQIMANVDQRPGLQGKCVSGGRLNLYKALTGGAPPPPALTARFTANPAGGPAPLNVQFTDTSTGNPASWSWNFGDGSAAVTAQNPTHTFSSAGNFTVTLTVADGSGATSSASQTITATSTTNSTPDITLTATQPNASFSGQVPGTINFHRTGDTSQSYQVNWSFSGTAVNGVDFQQLPTNSPFPAGQSDATLTITPINNGQTSDRTVIVTLAPGAAYQAGSPDSATVTIHASVTNAGPTASFTENPTSGQAPLTVQFTDTSSGSPVSWNWNFGDGATGTTQNPSHAFSSAGHFTVTLTVANNSSQTSSASQTITVTNSAAAAPDINVLGEFDQRTGTGVSIPPGDTTPSTTDGTDFGAVTVSNGVAGKTFAIQNTGNATLAITPPITLSGPNAADFTVTQPPATNLAAGATMQFEISFAPGAAGLRSTTVNIGNDVPNKNPYTFAIQGTGTNATVQPVTAAFAANPTSGQAPLAVQFTDQSSGPVTAWNWNFGDGSTSTVQSPSHTYTNAGNFSATLMVTGSSGQTSSTGQTITVTNAPQPVTANFTANPTSGQAPLAVQFTDQSSGPVTAWNWNFGDGSASTVQNSSHTYASAGNFTATLTVTGSSGQTSSASQTITVTNAPQPVTANFTANPTSGQAPLAVQFTDQSSGPVTAWNWNFGDGSTSTVQSPSHTYTSAGNFSATLMVTGSSGQTSSTSQTITITNAPPPPPTATVTVVATQPLATSLTPGVFSVSRSGDISSALTVNYSLGGTAQNGVDYQTLSGTAVIPAGSTTATVAVNPLGLLNVLKTVVLTVTSEPTYNVGSHGSATVEIVASVGL